MKQITVVLRALRTFWNDPQQRKTASWIVGAVSLAVMVFGAYLVLSSQREMNDLSDELDTIEGQIERFVADYPLVERDGEMTHDLTDATETDKQFLAMLHVRERETFNNRVDVENQRASGIRLIGIGVIGLALAYLVWPEGRRAPLAAGASGNASPTISSAEDDHL